MSLKIQYKVGSPVIVRCRADASCAPMTEKET